MTAPPDEVDAKVRQWIAFADEDLRLARHALSLTPDCPYRLVAYHAQQCAEKSLKAVLVHAGIDFPYTHNLSVLLELCPTALQSTPGMEDVEELTRFAITTRYPGVEEYVAPADAERAIAVATRVFAAVQSMLRDGGLMA